MNSYNTIINELITQKQLLDEKGFAVNTANTYPSPSEITEAINSINFDLSDSTATEADVLAGKTFYSQTNELKTGTLSVTSSQEVIDYMGALISGRGAFQIIIPNNITQIRPYAFAILPPGTDPNAFYYENLTIPSNITHIYEYAFYYTNITGTLTIPATVQEIYHRAFYYCNINECVIASLTPNATDIFQGCSNLRKIIVAEPVTTLYKSNFGYTRNISELVLPATLTSMETGTFSQASPPSVIRFLGETPPVITTKVFSDIPGAALLVPANAYYTYYNATNYTTLRSYIFGFQYFNAGDVLPDTLSGMPVKWFRDYIDAYYGSNNLTTSPSNRELIALFV